MDVVACASETERWRAGPELLTTAEMARADAAAIAAGTPGIALMERAGAALARAAREMAPDGGRVVVLAGPGNNGGDGFVAARLLAEAGYDVALALYGSRDKLGGDALIAADRWPGDVVPLTPAAIDGAALIIDAIFGAGLSRVIDGEVGAVIEAVNRSPAKTLAVDIASGVDGNSGAVRGVAVTADATVTFFRKKPGHLLLPGRLCCGDIEVADIGIADDVLDAIEPRAWVNGPTRWCDAFPVPAIGGHKYQRGHAIVVSGPPQCSGAARLGARGALRAGAGLVTVATPESALQAHAAQLNAIMVRAFVGAAGLAEILGDKRRNAVLVGPGIGVGESTRGLVLAALEAGPTTVIDADGLTSFERRFGELAEAIAANPQRPVVLTPHDGEFRRLFKAAWLYPEIELDAPLPKVVVEARASKLERTRRAAQASGAVVVSKGADTVIAAPDGRAAINDNAPAFLATAGAGDVLAGMIAGLLAQGMAAFEAACCAVWMHGAAAGAFGPGLTADDLPEALPDVLSRLLAGRSPRP